MLGAYGQYPFTDNSSSIRTMFSSASVGPAETYTLSKRDVEFVVSDRRVVSWDHMLGYYFYNPQTLETFEPQVVNKFDGLGGVTRVLDAGDIVLYDVRKFIASQSVENTTSSTSGRVP